MLTSAGTLFYALEYTLCEHIYTLYPKPVDAKQLCFHTGAWGMLFTLVWMVAVTGPRWNELVVEQVQEKGGNLWEIALLYASHTLNNGVHNYAWFVVCELEDGVSTGLLMGVKAAALFFFSAMSFCDAAHPEQCLTAAKVTATVTVMVGTCVYYLPQPKGSACCRPRPARTTPRDGEEPKTPSRRPGRAHRHARLPTSPVIEPQPSIDLGGDQPMPLLPEATQPPLEATEEPPTCPPTPPLGSPLCRTDRGTDLAAETPREYGPPTKINGTPLPLSTPNDHCKTPLVPSTGSTVADAPEGAAG